MTTSMPLLMMLSCLTMVVAVASAADLQSQCNNEITKLTECIKYSTGEADTPTDKCCASVTDIRTRNPVCLCYIIQQAGESASAASNLRIDRLLALPNACKIANASASACIKLLNLNPGSPAYVIFNGSDNAATANTSSPVIAKNSAFMSVPPRSAAFVVAAVVSAIFSSIF